MVNPFSVVRGAAPAYPALLAACALLSCLLCSSPLRALVSLWLQVNYAKQTQFRQRHNLHNILCRKHLQQYYAPSRSKKQTQTNPIPPTQYAAEAPCGAIRNTQYEKQTQTNPIYHGEARQRRAQAGPVAAYPLAKPDTPRYEIRFTRYEIRFTRYEIRFTRYEIRFTRYEIRRLSPARQKLPNPLERPALYMVQSPLKSLPFCMESLGRREKMANNL